MDSEIDERKLKLMWDQIIDFEKKNCFDGSQKSMARKVEEIIDEVYRQCY